jgi:hypothetical protein
MSKPQPPFLRLPLELRLHIYRSLLLHDPCRVVANTGPVPLSNLSGYYAVPEKTDDDAIILRIRAEDPASYKLRAPKIVRDTFVVRSGVWDRCLPTTYFALNKSGIYTSLLLANAQIHAEAAEVLYSSHVFDFDTHMEAFVAFLGDLTPFARNCIRSIRLVKRALAYEKEYSKAEWSIAMEWLGRLGRLKSLSLGIVAGKPGPHGWDGVPILKPDHFDILKGTEGMEWVQELLSVKGLEDVQVDAIVEHCPSPSSAAMTRYIQFSASIEKSFGPFLLEKMVKRS